MEWLNDSLAWFCDVTIADKLCDDLYSKDLNVWMAEACLTVSLMAALVFYKLIDSPSFQRGYHWLIVLAINFLVNLIIGMAIPQHYLPGLGYSFLDYFKTGMEWATFSIPVFMLWSLIIKRFSKNCRTTPF